MLEARACVKAGLVGCMLSQDNIAATAETGEGIATDSAGLSECICQVVPAPAADKVGVGGAMGEISLLVDGDGVDGAVTVGKPVQVEERLGKISVVVAVLADGGEISGLFKTDAGHDVKAEVILVRATTRGCAEAATTFKDENISGRVGRAALLGERRCNGNQGERRE